MKGGHGTSQEVSLQHDTLKVVQAVCFTALALEFFQEVLLITLHIHLGPLAASSQVVLYYVMTTDGIMRGGEGTQSEECLLCKHEDLSVNPASPAGFGGMSLESQPWASRGRRIP